MKQKAVLCVSMGGKKKSIFRDCWGDGCGVRSNALQIVVGVPGVESAAVKGQEKNEIEVIGDDIDVAKLTTLLRKKVGYTKVVSVVEVKKDPPPPKKETPAPSTKPEPPATNPNWNPPPCYLLYPREPEPYYYCSIL